MPIELISQPLKTSTFSIPSYYASIISENENEYQVKFIFNMQRSDFENKDISKLKIKFYPENYSNQKTDQTTKVINKQTKEYDNVEKSKSETNQLLMESVVNLQNYNVKIKKKRRVLSKISPLNKNDSSGSNIDVKEINLFIIKIFKVDPSYVLKNYLKLGNKEFKDLANYYLTTTNQNIAVNYPRYQTISDQSEPDTIFMSHIVKIPKIIQGAKLKKFDLVFELFAEKDVVSSFETLTKKLDLDDLFNNTYSLKEPAFTESTNKTSCKLSATTLDELANRLFLQKKTIDYNGSTSFYKNIDARIVSKDNSFEIYDPQDENKINIYRCVSTFDQINSDRSIYKNLVTGRLSFLDSTVMLTSNSTKDRAVMIELLNIPSEVLTYKLEKKLLLQGSQGGYDGKTVLVSNFKNKDDKIVFDYNVIKNRTYEYILTYRLKNNSHVTSVSKLHKYLEPQTTISTQVTNPVMSSSPNGDAVITFNVTSKFEQNNNELLKSALENAGIGEQFANEIKGEKAFFQDLLFFKVKRINLSTSPGIEEEFKDFLDVSADFSDNELNRNTSGVSKLDLSQLYRYEIRAFLKNPITLLPKYVKVIEAQTINGTYYKRRAYRPYKWFQKSVLETGTTNSENEDGQVVDSPFLQDSDIGVVATVELDTLKRILGVKNVLANRITVEKINLKWDIKNSGDYYDHFVIVKEVNHVRKILTTTHNKSYVDIINAEKDMGNIRYYVTPVYYDYTVGTTVASQIITIDPEEYDQSQS